MAKIVINTCYGGFGLSPKAIAFIFKQRNPDIKLWYYKKTFDNRSLRYTYNIVEDAESASYVSLKYLGDTIEDVGVNQIKINDNFVFSHQINLQRHDPLLVKTVETLGEEADGAFSELKVVDVDTDRYIIKDYDGLERVVTPDMIHWIEI